MEPINEMQEIDTFPQPSSADSKPAVIQLDPQMARRLPLERIIPNQRDDGQSHHATELTLQSLSNKIAALFSFNPNHHPHPTQTLMPPTICS